ncbi:unnamed protein product [Nyctereutes procyonoides]|uniref:(raccoon dog) hypothetical protein n=1 Tax=Nyctereutes procyonoides TaxID=34880 RepID=A0A811YRY4_NYCPR|nr:unnamed protein product [Nyctereutes procyonoides]
MVKISLSELKNTNLPSSLDSDQKTKESVLSETRPFATALALARTTSAQLSHCLQNRDSSLEFPSCDIGIFKKSAGIKSCRILKQKLNSGDRVNLDSESVLVVASVLKQCLLYFSVILSMLVEWANKYSEDL